MEVNRFQAMVMAIFVGNIPQKKPAGMLMAVRIFGKIPLEAAEIDACDGKPWATLLPLVNEAPVEIELSPDESKFMTKLMVDNVNFGGRVLSLLIPLWEELYPKWEEFGDGA